MDCLDSSRLLPQDVEMIIYHSPCLDGTGSAFAAWKYFSNHDNESKIDKKNLEYIPTSIGKAPPDVTDKNVMICDFSYRKDVLLDMISKAKNILIIDHHETAMKDLESIPNQYKIFDMKHSGAYLTWKYFFPDQPVPLLIEYIQDHDIWTKKLPLTDECSAWMSTLKSTSPEIFELFNQLLDEEKLMNEIKTLGVPYLKYINHTVDEKSKRFMIKFTEIRDRGKEKYYFIIYKNSTIHLSELGNRLITDNPIADFAVVYCHSEWGTTSFSLRSDDQHVNVADIARNFGGGGHRNASGARSDHLVNVLKQPASDNFDLYKKLFEVYPAKLSVNNRTLDVIYLCTNINKRKLGKYLLQTRVGKRQNAHVCLELIAKYENIKDDEKKQSMASQMAAKYYQTDLANISEKIIRFDLAITWTYDPVKDSTMFIFNFHPEMKKEEIDQISKYYQLNEYSDVILDGCHRVVDRT